MLSTIRLKLKRINLMIFFCAYPLINYFKNYPNYTTNKKIKIKFSLILRTKNEGLSIILFKDAITFNFCLKTLNLLKLIKFKFNLKD